MSWPNIIDVALTLRENDHINNYVPKLNVLAFSSLNLERVFLVLTTFLAPNGAAAGFWPDPGLDLGGWSLRRGFVSNMNAGVGLYEIMLACLAYGSTARDFTYAVVC
jgi:hypothetical protein